LCCRAFALGKPGVELQLEVELVRDALPRVEVALQEVLQPLDDALGLRVARLAEEPVEPERAAERDELRSRPPAASVQPGLAIPDELLRQRTERTQAARMPNSRSGVCLEKFSAPAAALE
jgi:hypothetical protein